MTSQSSSFKWRHFLPEIILLCVRWYLRYPLSYRHLSEMMLERRLEIAHTTIYRWVISYSPKINQRCRRHLRSTSDSWRVDETYVKVKGKWQYLYRAIDSQGQTIDFLLSEQRDTNAAKRFLRQSLRQRHAAAPRVINTDKDKAYPVAIKDLTASEELSNSVEHRPTKYLNNIIEQDHRYTKRRVIASQHFRDFWSAKRTIAGYEAMNMIRKGQIKNVGQDNVLGQIEFIHSLFGITA